MITIQFQNISTAASDAQIQPMLVDITAQINEDVAPVWGTQPLNAVWVPKGKAMDARAWQFVIADTSDQAGALGYHETTAAGEPIGYAFAKSTIDAGMHLSVTLSHEVAEMYGDAFIDQWCQWSDLPNALFLCQELCDPVEDDSLAYTKGSTLVSDFVTPEYFIPNSTGPWDFMKHLTAPNNLTSGGYQITWDPTNGTQQKMDRANPSKRLTLALANPYSRVCRRSLARTAWRRSMPNP